MFNHIDKKRFSEKLKRAVKYWRVRYRQFSERERTNLYLLTFLMVTYVWWMVIVL